jgi:hypothetical protein
MTRHSIPVLCPGICSVNGLILSILISNLFYDKSSEYALVLMVLADYIVDPGDNYCLGINH